MYFQWASHERLFILHNMHVQLEPTNRRQPATHSPYVYVKTTGFLSQNHNLRGDDTDERSEGHKWHRE